MSFQDYYQDIQITSAWRRSFSLAKSLASSDMAEEIFSVDTRANFFSVAASFCLSSASRRSKQSILFRNWFWKKKKQFQWFSKWFGHKNNTLKPFTGFLTDNTILAIHLLHLYGNINLVTISNIWFCVILILNRRINIISLNSNFQYKSNESCNQLLYCFMTKLIICC